MLKHFKLLNICLFVLYISLLLVGIVFNPSITSYYDEILTDDVVNHRNYATLVDNKGHFIVYNKNLYEAWIDIEFLKRRNYFDRYKYLINSRFTDSQIEARKFIKWGTYNTHQSALNDLGLLAPFSSIHQIKERNYNELFTLPQLIGKVNISEFGIENYLLNNNMLNEKEKIILTFDLSLQSRLQQELTKVVREREADGAIGIIMETKTGKIRSSVSTYPWNMSFMGYIEPGSTIKPMLYGMALDHNLIQSDHIFDTPREIKPLENVNFTVREIENRIFGKINLKDAIIHSSNITMIQTMIKMMEKYSVEWFYNNLRNMGFGEKTGIEFTGEINGILQNPRNWYQITPYQIAIGQGIGVTPIQLISSFNALINNGLFVKPTFLEDSNPLTRRHYTECTSKILREYMNYSTITGTARNAYIPGLRIGGKTGTAEKAIPGIGYTKENYYSLYIGYYPASNPIYTFLIIVDNPKGEFYGGEVAAPIISQVLYDYKKTNQIVDLEYNSYFKNRLPDLTGMSKFEAYNLLLNFGFNDNQIILTGNGDKVLEQFPEKGSNFNDIIYIHLKSN